MAGSFRRWQPSAPTLAKIESTSCSPSRHASSTVQGLGFASLADEQTPKTTTARLERTRASTTRRGPRVFTQVKREGEREKIEKKGSKSTYDERGWWEGGGRRDVGCANVAGQS
jgi:hypothetical protein